MNIKRFNIVFIIILVTLALLGAGSYYFYSQRPSQPDINRITTNNGSSSVSESSSIEAYKEIIRRSRTLPVSTSSTIQLLSPNGGEKIKFGSTYTVRWEAKNIPDGAQVVVWLTSLTAHTAFLNRGGVLIWWDNASRGEFSWKVVREASAGGETPLVTLEDHNDYRIRIELYGEGDINCIVSDVCFSIRRPSLIALDESDGDFSLE